MKHTFKYFVWMIVAACSTVACDDMFETDPGNILNEKDYISSESEIYRGFLGIVTKMQEVGDHAIYLTDPRCDYLEATGNAPVALQNINNYDATDGNEYADPTGYYNVIVSCNDYISKMGEYYQKSNGVMSDSVKSHFPRLISNAVRMKVWAYYMLGRIYGEAYWYDSNLTEVTDLNNKAVFEYLDMAGICNKCIQLLDNGIDVAGMHIASDLTMDWTRWVDPVSGDASYDFWKYMTPQWLMLRAELVSWRTNYEDAAAAKADWLWVRNTVLSYLSEAFTNAATAYYPCTMQTTLHYYEMFFSEQVGYDAQLVTGIFYRYQNGQKNRLVQYLCPSYPGDGYYLKPSDYAQGKYNESDLRGPVQLLVSNTINGQACLTKYYYYRGSYLRSHIYEIEPTILLYRGVDYHFLLAEAENHLGHWEVASTLLNNGILNRFPGGAVTLPTDSLDGDRIWSLEYANWFAPSGGYGDIGIVGCVRGAEHELGTPADYDSEEARIKAYDLALADEYLKEFTGEGKSYSYLCKMAERYGKDYTVIYDRVKGKYDSDKQGAVESSLRSKYFIDWNLKSE